MPGLGAGFASTAGTTSVGPDDAVAAISQREADAPRWVLWSSDTARALVAAGVRLRRSWDVVEVDRLLHGRWRTDPARAWAGVHGLARDALPAAPADDLFSLLEPAGGTTPVRDDGYLDPAWVPETPDRLAEWAALALAAAQRQRALVGDPSTAHAESTAELLCAELEADGLPVDRPAMEAVIAGFCGPRPRTAAEADALRAERDGLVLEHVPADAAGADLRSPGQVKSLLRRVGIEVPDTRAWRLERLRDEHPIVPALLAWRKAERVATTYGYGWLDETVAADGRLRGQWTASDGAAGRMTASAGLHNLPADLRAGVVADPGWAFVRADLGQIEPRVLAVVAGDAALARATQDDDLYALVARDLGVERPTAKVAVLGAMYGQTTGIGADAGRRLRDAYPVAMAFLDAADRAAQAGEDLQTFGGRRVRTRVGADRAQVAAMGRYGRNAMVQGAAAELFKRWAVTVRAHLRASDARIVLCLHDELLVHAPAADADDVAALLRSSLDESSSRWARGAPVRFVADVSVVRCWADAKA